MLLQFHSNQITGNMGSKSIVFLGLFCAVVLLIASEVTARELDETSTSKETAEKTEQTNGIEDAKYGGGGYPGGGNGGGYGGGGYPGGGNGGGYGGGPGGGYGGGNGGRGGYCRYRCCRRDYNGGCRRCCSYEGEAMEKGN